MLGSAGLLGLAAGAGAIMISPNMALGGDPVLDTAIERDGSKAPWSVADPFHQMFIVGCPGCPFGERKGHGFEWKKDIKNKLVLDIAIGQGRHSIDLNGMTIYPHRGLQGAAPVFIPQIRNEVSLKEIEDEPAKYLSHPLHVDKFSVLETIVHSASNEELVKVELDFGRLQGQAMDVPNVVISAIKNTKGQLMLTKIETAGHDRVGDKCISLKCKFNSIINKFTASISIMREKVSDTGKSMTKALHGHSCAHPHHHKKPTVTSTKHKIDVDNKTKHKHRPGHKNNANHPKKPEHKSHHKGDGTKHEKPAQHHHHSQSHRQHTKFHRIMHKIARVLLTIVIPIGVGIIAGMLTYILGMALGTLIALVWMTFRRSSWYYAPIALDEGRYEDDVFYEYDGPEKDEDYVDEEGFEAPPLYVEVEGTAVLLR